MRRSRLVGVAALVTVLVLAGASPATAGVAMKASGDVAFEQPSAFCAPGVLVIQGSGPGTLTLGAFDGDVEVAVSQCTGFLQGGPSDPDATVTVGKVTDGSMTLTATSGVLVLAYEGGFVANANGTQGYGHWVIADGTGIFAAASGHGAMHLSGTDPFALHVDLMGSVVVP